MANPRKFSEKIAIQRQKQAEETAAFEQIMRDVITATRGSNHASSSINKNQQHLHINPSVGNCRAESLPDVNRIGVSPEQSSIDLKSCLNILDDMRRGRDPIRRHPSPNATSRSPHRHSHISGGHSRSSYNEQRRGDSSPYSPVYLSPPMDTNWRRTNSDSALHQTGLMAEQLGACSPLHQPGSPLSPVGPHSGASSPRRSTVHSVETTSSTNAIYTVASTPSPNSSEYNSVINSNLGAGNQQLHLNPDNLQDVTNGMSFTANGNTMITSNIESDLQQQQGERDSQPSDIHHQQQAQLHHPLHQPQQQQQQQLIQNGNYNEHIRDSAIYLSPLPMDSSNWRRANSDSRLHQTVMMADQMDNSPLHHHHLNHINHLNHHHHQQQQQPSQQLLNELATSRRSTAQSIGTNNIFAGTTTSLTSNNTNHINNNGQEIIDSSSYPPTFPAHNSWDPGKKINPLNSPNVDLLPASLPNDSRPKSTGGVPGIKIETLDENNVNNNIHQQHPHLQNPHLNHHHSPLHLQHGHHNHHHHHHHHLSQQHPSFANTGSLPDLTNLPFTTSLPPAIDLDEPSLSPVTHIMANTMLTDAYPSNASPSPGSPYNCVSPSSSISYANQSTNDYSSSPSSSASFVQQSNIFTQSTFASHNETNHNHNTNSNNSNSNNNTNHHTTNTTTNHTAANITNNTNNLITANLNTHTNTATNTEITSNSISNMSTDVLVSNQDYSKGNGSTIILPSSNTDLSELLANEEAFRQSLDPMTSIDFEDLQLLTAEFT